MQQKIKQTPGNTSWFRHDRFGMFIHWGLYALPARHEWVKSRECMSDEAYDRYLSYFDPDLFDAKQWAKAAKAAGMKYAVMTAKHHDGFCMFDSAYTNYKCTATPAGRDLIREYTEAFRSEGLKVGFYYSLLDWHHPDFTIDVHHPMRDLPEETIKQLNSQRDMHRYAEYIRNQVQELLTHYGKIDIIWFDFSYPDYALPGKPWLQGKGSNEWEAEKLISLTRSLQPGILIDNRTGLEQDFFTPEQYQPKEWLRHPETGELVTWEACQTFSGSWGYYRDETSWKSPNMLLRMLIETVSLGGNLIMNVGPTARGYFDARAESSLKVFSDWMHYNSRSIYGCTMADESFISPNGTCFTQTNDGSRLYIHLFDYPFEFLELPGFSGKVEYAQFLHDGSELKFTEHSVPHFSEGCSNSDDLLVIELPILKPPVEVPVIELFIKTQGS